MGEENKRQLSNSALEASTTDDIWKLRAANESNILRDCLGASFDRNKILAYSPEPRPCGSADSSDDGGRSGNNLIDNGDIKQRGQEHPQLQQRSANLAQATNLATTLSATATSAATNAALVSVSSPPNLAQQQQQSTDTSVGINRNNKQQHVGDLRRVRFKSLLTSATIIESDEIVGGDGSEELKTINFTNVDKGTNQAGTARSLNSINCDSLTVADFASTTIDTTTRTDSMVINGIAPENQKLLDDNSEASLDNSNRGSNQLQRGNHNDNDDNRSSTSSDEDELYNCNKLRNHNRPSRSLNSQSSRKESPSFFKSSSNTHSFGRRILSRFKLFDQSSDHPYIAYEDKDLLTGTSKYSLGKKKQSLGRTFRGSYRYSRAEISMAIFKKLTSLLIQRSTLALFGAFLIHVTLGTVYTLSNINSYLTSYMRKHGSLNATYGGSMWISSSYAVGQGFSMVLGGYIEKRFSAQLACTIGCALHSMSIISTSWSVDHGPLAVLVTYGFIPGFGCGLAYMTPMSNGFGWFPDKKGLVAGVILAGFGIGTFVFNMAQTAFVNPDNLSPLANANGYFTQHTVLDKVPHLFVFIGSIYAAMQFVGCCLLFKPPNTYGLDDKSSDKRPIQVENEMTLGQAIRTREFVVLFMVYGVTTQGVLFVNSMLKEYGQTFIDSDMYLAWTGSMASIANSFGRLAWGLAIDRYSFTQCFTTITIIFGSLMFLMPFEFVLSSRLLYLLCTLGLFGSFSGWMSTYPVHLSRVFGRTNSGIIYGLIFVSQSCGGIVTAFGAHYLIDHFNRFVPFFCVVILEIIGLSIYHLFYPK